MASDDRIRRQAIAYRIWSVAEPEGWNLTHGDIAEELDLSCALVTSICREKGWSSRLRAAKSDYASRGVPAGVILRGDNLMDQIAGMMGR